MSWQHMLISKNRKRQTPPLISCAESIFAKHGKGIFHHILATEAHIKKKALKMDLTDTAIEVIDALSICCLQSRTLNLLADTGRNPLASRTSVGHSMMSSREACFWWCRPACSSWLEWIVGQAYFWRCRLPHSSWLEWFVGQAYFWQYRQPRSSWLEWIVGQAYLWLYRPPRISWLEWIIGQACFWLCRPPSSSWLELIVGQACFWQ